MSENLTELTKNKLQLIETQKKVGENHKKEMQLINDELKSIETKINLIKGGLDAEKIKIAEEILDIRGTPLPYTCYKTLDEITNDAIRAISNETEFFKTQHFWLKNYSGFIAQSGYSDYGYGPKHGQIVFGIGFKRDWRNQLLSPEDKEACLYFLYNLVGIFRAKPTFTAVYAG